MRQVAVDTVISAPCEEVFDFVADLSRRPSFCDHYLKDYRLARANPVGMGAAARFLLDGPVFSERAGVAVVELQRPRRIVEEGGVGRRGRSRLAAVYTFSQQEDGKTHVELTTCCEPATAIDRLRQGGTHRWVKRQTRKALSRLRQILEEPGRETLTRVTMAGYDPAKAPRFGAHVPAGKRPASADG
ncbi:MAG: SRPBCC family protein [Thermoleophilaceae bacterium]